MNTNPIRNTVHMMAMLVVCLQIAAEPRDASGPPGPPELKDGDVVALIGGGFIEREGQYGYIETALTARYADRNIKFRNLGWSGDNVWCESRAYFGTAEDGFKHLMEHVDLVKPTVIIVNYGANEAFAGKEGLPRFIEGYNRLLDELEKRTNRIVLMSPMSLFASSTLSKKLVNEYNEKVYLYRDAIYYIGYDRGHISISLTGMPESFKRLDTELPTTIDGFQLSQRGHQWVAIEMVELFYSGPLGIIKALSPQFKQLGADGQLELIRSAVIDKNELFFRRHRPQNETYLRGFRKHEQGNNAKEIYKFEELVDEADAKIAALREKLYDTLRTSEVE